MGVVYRMDGYVMVVGIVLMVLMNQLIAAQQIERVQLVFGNVIMADVSAQINDAMVSMIAGKKKRFNLHYSNRKFFFA
jgi:hypothetical protein